MIASTEETKRRILTGILVKGTEAKMSLGVGKALMREM